MLLVTHATAGAVIGQFTGNPVLAFIFGFVIHFLMDMIPHGDVGISDNFRIYKRRRKQAVTYAVVDGAATVLFVLFLFNTRDILSLQNFTWGIAGSVLPDLMVGLYDLTKLKFLKWFSWLHFFCHDIFVRRRGDVPLYYAVLAQMVLIAYLQTKL